MSKRNDATRIKSITGLNQILIDLKPKRSLGEVYINQKIDVTNVVKYVNKHKEENTQDSERITIFHVFASAIGKVIYNRSKLNRFINNRHLYEHNNVILSFVAKISFKDNSEQVMLMLPVEKSDTIFDISKKINEKVIELRKKKEAKDGAKGANNAILTLGKLPNIIRVPIVGIMKYLDRIGKLPHALVKDNLYYSSMIISNIGSLKCSGIYHNLTDFGTCSGLITMGEVKKEVVKNENNIEEEKYYCEFGATIDERIADGYYLIKSIHLIEKLLEKPELLEVRVDEKVEIE